MTGKNRETGEIRNGRGRDEVCKGKEEDSKEEKDQGEEKGRGGGRGNRGGVGEAIKKKCNRESDEEDGMRG